MAAVHLDPDGLGVGVADLIARGGGDGAAGVVYRQQQNFAVCPGCHRDMADILTFLHAVFDGVFDQRLQREVRQIPLLKVSLRFQRKGSAALVAQLLDVDIAAHKLHIGGGGRVLLGGERRPQHIAQVDDEPPGLLIFAGAHKPAQGAEGVVQKGAG